MGTLAFHFNEQEGGKLAALDLKQVFFSKSFAELENQLFTKPLINTGFHVKYRWIKSPIVYAFAFFPSKYYYFLPLFHFSPGISLAYTKLKSLSPDTQRCKVSLIIPQCSQPMEIRKPSHFKDLSMSFS